MGGAVALALAWAAPSARAQGTAVGGVVGTVTAKQLRARSADSDERGGFLAGAWIDVDAPPRWLSILAEASFVRRGGAYDLDERVRGVPVEVDYLSLAVLPTFGVRVGPASLRAFAGPAVDMNLRTATAAQLEPVFREANAQVFSLAAGVGGGVRRGRTTIRLEGRRHWQVGSAFAGDVGEVRHRSTELLLRVGVRPAG